MAATSQELHHASGAARAIQLADISWTDGSRDVRLDRVKRGPSCFWSCAVIAD